MAKKKNKGKAAKPNWKLWGPVLGVAVAAAFFLLVRVLGGPTSVAYKEAILLDDGTLLLVGSSGSDVDTNRAGRILELGPDGTTRVFAELDGATSLIGLGDGVVWVDTQGLGIHARRLDDLTAILETQGKVDAHAALKTKRRALGIAGDRVVVEGADGFPYTLALDGTVEKQAKDFAYARARFADALGGGDGPLPSGCRAGDASSQALFRKLGETLSEASPLPCGRRRGFVGFDDPAGWLIVDTAYDADARRRRLGRVGDDGALVWAVPLSEVVAAAPFEEDGVVSVVWSGYWDGQLRALVQSQHTERNMSDDGTTRDIYTVEHRLVSVDPASGAAQATVVVEPPET